MCVCVCGGGGVGVRVHLCKNYATIKPQINFNQKPPCCFLFDDKQNLPRCQTLKMNLGGN